MLKIKDNSFDCLNMSEPWQIELRNSFIKPEKLLEVLELPAHFPYAKTRFPIQATESYIANIEKGQARDPLFLQIWPFPEEGRDQLGFTSDCLSENALFHSNGIIDKYANRSLVISTSACAIHCRYCFRREFSYPTKRDSALTNLNAHLELKEVREIILSGGDPLVLGDEELLKLFASINEYKQIETVRFHTRVPIVLPSRMTIQLQEALQSLLETKQVVFVIHANHPREISNEVKKVLLKLKSMGIHLLNQSVLLRDINDNASTLSELSHKLFESGVLPYYLHQLDRVKGAHHFEVAESEGLRIIEQLRKTLPGYLVPRYVKEVIGEVSKTPVNDIYVQQKGIENGKI